MPTRVRAAAVPNALTAVRLVAVATLTVLLAISAAPDAASGQPVREAPADPIESVREAFAQSAHDIGIAYFSTHSRVEPNLNGISISAVPDKPPNDRPLVSQLVAHASRRELSTIDAFENHVSAMANDNVPCTDSGAILRAQMCTAAGRHRLPSLEPAPHGALELVAAARTEASPVTAFDLLTAAFEIAAWRPAGIHPQTAEAARRAAAQMRLRTRNADQPCHISALWVAAAVAAEAPDIRLAIAGFWLDGDKVAPLVSQARYAARNGCQAAISALGRAQNPPPARLAFWDPQTVLVISARTDAEIARTLGEMTGGNLRPRSARVVPGRDAVASHSAAEPFRACDAITEVAASSDTASVRGIRVHVCLEDSLRALLADARRGGIVMSGWGWRSTAAQIGLRQAHCPLPSRDAADYWLQLSLLPSFSCDPPVARPTTSQHEYGLAVDFTCGTSGAPIDRTSRCYEWLAENAHRYGFYNLLFEPWHWSTTGR